MVIKRENQGIQHTDTISNAQGVSEITVVFFIRDYRMYIIYKIRMQIVRGELVHLFNGIQKWERQI